MKTSRGIILILIGFIFLFSHPAQARRVRGDFNPAVTFGPKAEWDEYSAPGFSFNEIKEMVSNVLANDHDFVSQTLETIFGKIISLSEIVAFHVSEKTGGSTEVVLKVDVTLCSGEIKAFCLNVSTGNYLNYAVDQDFKNLKALYEKNPMHVVRPIAKVYGFDNGNTSRACMFSTVWYEGTDIVFSEEGIIKEFLSNERKNGRLVNSPKESSRIREEMAKILTLYYDSEEEVMIGYYGHDGLTLGACIRAGDFMYQIQEQDTHLLLTTAREFIPNVDIPHFIHGLLAHKENFGWRQECLAFEPQEVFFGIIKGLVELYGQKPGVEMARQWFCEYKRAVEEEIVPDNFIDELDVALEALNQP